MKKKQIAVILKGYPRVDELFIVQELVELERRGYELLVFSLVQPEFSVLQNIHGQLKVKVVYVPKHKRELRASSWSFFLQNPIKSLEAWLLYRRQAVSSEQCLKRFMQSLWIAAYFSNQFKGVLYTHFINAPSLVGMGVAHLKGLTWFAFAHAKDIYCSDPKILKLRLSSARKIFSCNQESASYLSDIHPHVKLVYHGITTDHFSNRGATARSAPHFIVMARLVAKKGHLFLLEVLKNLKQNGIKFSCIFYGEGELRQEIENCLQAYKLEQEVVLYGTYRLNEIASQISKGDFYLSPFVTTLDGDRDGIPNSMLEAMYLECVVVSHKTAAIAEVLSESKNGYFVAPQVSAWVSKLKELVGRDHDQVTQMARQTVEERFLFKHCVEELTNTFDNV